MAGLGHKSALHHRGSEFRYGRKADARDRSPNVRLWLDPEVAASLINVRCYLRSGHPEFNVRLYEAFSVKVVLIFVA